MTQVKTNNQPDNKNAKPVLRDSSYGDYVAVDMVDERGLIVSTPFYIKEGQIIEAHWPKPSNEQPKNPIHYDDFNDVFQFLMEDGYILSKWANSGLNSVFEMMDKKDLLTWEFHKARKIKVIESVKQPDKEGLQQPLEDSKLKYYQPDIDINGNIVGHEYAKGFHSFMVWHSEDKLLEAYPNCTPIEYSGDDIEEPTFMDEKPTPDKEGLHTQGANFETLRIGLATDDEDCQLINELGEEILIIKSYPLKENAETIMRAVNERKALLDSHRELLESLKELTSLYFNGGNTVTIAEANEKAKTAINNSKNIK